jgi:hypothetical protein
MLNYRSSTCIKLDEYDRSAVLCNNNNYYPLTGLNLRRNNMSNINLRILSSLVFYGSVTLEIYKVNDTLFLTARDKDKKFF